MSDLADVCDYCDATLVLGVNWTEGRKRERHRVCRTCASAIARGVMDRRDRLRPRMVGGRPREDGKAAQAKVLQDPSTADMLNHNTELLGSARAHELRRLRDHVRSQWTDEISESLARPYREIVQTINLRKSS